MLATLQKTNASETDTALPSRHGSDVIDLPHDVQASLDRLLHYYRDNALKPMINACGDPLTICSTLVTQVKQITPAHLETDAKTFLDYMIKQIVAYCREHNAGHLTLDFTFEREGNGGLF